MFLSLLITVESQLAHAEDVLGLAVDPPIDLIRPK
jgi:hypothetical protein